MANKFRFDFDFDLIKATGVKIIEKKDLDYENMFMQGIASTVDKDMEGETLDPRTFDLKYFMDNGKINYNHGIDVIGEPVEAKILENGDFFLKARLYTTSETAKKVYENAYIMQADPNSTRRMSWSVEGQATERDKNNPKKVTKAVITEVAATKTPINYKRTYAEVVKSFMGKTEFEEELNPDLSLLNEKLERWGLTYPEYMKKVNEIWITKGFETLPIEQVNSFIDIWTVKKSFGVIELAKTYLKLRKV